MYLEKRRRRWYACHDIPEDVQASFGRRRFVQSLECEDRPTAERRGAIHEARWRTEIAKARAVSPCQIERDALYWRQLYVTAPEHEKPVIRDMIGDEAQLRLAAELGAHGIYSDNDPRYSDHPAVAATRKFVGLATGQVVRLDEHLEEYLGTLRNEAKSVDMRRSTIKKFGERFPYVSDVSKKAVQRWCNEHVEAKKAVATIRRSLSELRGYWAYLQSIEIVAEDHQPFDKLTLPREGKKAVQDARQPFKPADVVKLWRKAVDEWKDQELADLIVLGMWTGCRLEELCALPVADVDLGGGFFIVQDAKTPAGNRFVPIHSKLAPTLVRLIGKRTEGYVLSGLSENKYSDRSNAIGKRFGRLKTEAKFRAEYVFHSIRKTVATIFENAHVPENVSADIMGHEKPTMTYGKYSGGTSLEVRREAIEKLAYPDVPASE